MESRSVTFAGDLDSQRALRWAYDCVGSTPYGAALIYELVMSDVDYTITSAKDGDAFYSWKTNTISVDPNFHPDTQVDTGLGLQVQPAPTSAVLGHEIGHAATGIRE